MKVTLYMAISIDGYIATETWDSEWISEHDIEIFDKITWNSDCVIIWNTTYNQYKWEIYPISNIHNIVVSSKQQEEKDNVSFTKSPKSAVQIAQGKWYENVVLVWGWHINGSFIKHNLIDEIIIDIQPIILGSWIKLFEQIDKQVNLEFIEHVKLKWWLNMLKYKIKK